MRFGVILPNLGALASPEALITLAQRAEVLGFDGLFLSDHLTLPTDLRSRYPYRSDGAFPLQPHHNILEPVTTLAYLAAVTSRVRLGLSVLVLPYRHPVLNAKMLTTLDLFSGGRLIVGAGVGWMEGEFQVLGADYHHRGKVTDEHIQVLKTLWTQANPEFTGRHFQVAGITMYPKAAQRPHPPIWTGGISPQALRRAAYLADGWHGVRMTPEEVASTCQQLRRLRQQVGADFQRFEVSLRAGLDLTATAQLGQRLPLRGSPEQVAEDVVRYQEGGLTYLVVEPRARDTAELADKMERLARDVWSRL